MMGNFKLLKYQVGGYSYEREYFPMRFTSIICNNNNMNLYYGYYINIGNIYRVGSRYYLFYMGTTCNLYKYI